MRWTLVLTLLSAGASAQPTPGASPPSEAQRATPTTRPVSTSATPPGQTARLLPRTIERELHTRETLRQILALDEYAEAERSRPRRIDEALSALMGRLREQLRQWMQRLPRDRKAPFAGRPIHLPSPLILGAGALAFAFLILAIARYTRRARSPNLPASTSKGLEETAEHELQPEHDLDEASSLARRGQYRDALRTVYLATLIELDRKGFIDLDRATTNGQYPRQRSAAPVRGPLQRLTHLFDGVWYGMTEATETQYVLGRDLATQIAELVEPLPARRDRGPDEAKS